jgi:signal transduction histidine kinase
MLERIELLMNSLREVSDNIAHDLKTPLSRLRNRVEAALRDPRGPEAYREGLERTIEEADELIKTFNALLLIARLEAGAVEESAEGFDLGKLVRDVGELYEPVAEEAGQRLEIGVEDGIIVRANRQLVGQAVANLADNAIKYASRAGGSAHSKCIEVCVKARDGTAEISVADHGPGIAEKDRERALRRFVRLDESRTRPGTGLGLSLVAAVARLHGGTVRLEDNHPGLRAVLALPLAGKVPPPAPAGV